MMTSVKECIGWNSSKSRQLLFCLVFTFAIGFAANGIILTDPVLSHDSLSQALLTAGEFKHQVGLGRYLIPVYAHIMRGTAVLPWLFGLMAFLFLGLAVFLTARLFGIENKLGMGLLSGIFTANIAVTALAATYVTLLDMYMFALLFAVFAAYCWNKDTWIMRGIACAAGAICLSIYQSYISVGIGLMMVMSILDLLKGKEIRQVIRKDLWGIAIQLASGILYYIGLKLALRIVGTSLSSNYNGLTNIKALTISEFIPRLRIAYQKFFAWCTEGYTSYTADLFRVCNTLLGVIAAVLLVTSVIRYKTKRLSLVLITALLLLLPFALNVSAFLSGMSHTLMHFAFALVYVPFIAALKTELPPGGKNVKQLCFDFTPRIAACLLIGLVIWGNVQVANSVDTEKKIKQNVMLSYMTKLSYDMNAVDGYVSGTTPVIIAGNFDSIPSNNIFGIRHVTGYAKMPVTYENTCSQYFRYILGIPINCRNVSEINSMSPASIEAFENMPLYPAAGSIRMLEDTLVVKTGRVNLDKL